jgi:hypothetical protein
MILPDLPSPAEASNDADKALAGLRAGGKPETTFRDHALM